MTFESSVLRKARIASWGQDIRPFMPLIALGAAFAAFIFWQQTFGDTIVYDENQTYESPDYRLNYPDRTFVSDWKDPNNPPCPGSPTGEHDWGSMQKDFIWICHNPGCPLAWSQKHSST